MIVQFHLTRVVLLKTFIIFVSGSKEKAGINVGER